MLYNILFFTELHVKVKYFVISSVVYGYFAMLYQVREVYAY